MSFWHGHIWRIVNVDKWAYGAKGRPMIYLADKRGRIQETITVGPTQKTMGFQQFMETYADDDAVTTEGQ